MPLPQPPKMRCRWCTEYSTRMFCARKRREVLCLSTSMGWIAAQILSTVHIKPVACLGILAHLSMSFRFVSEETFNTLRSPVLGAVSISGHCNPISAPRYLYNQTSHECFSSAADKQLSLSTNPSSMHALCKNRRRKDFVSHFLRELNLLLSFPQTPSLSSYNGRRPMTIANFGQKYWSLKT